ncbi:DnaJ family domain-containing protein [Paenibacillus provencensis]|uniref:DnaJ family domain-containing protein n=1 Tax=Paenibacillus provencensis TaxID=441151 RepID=A0ABW3PW77_9BACL|nr:DnaJ family domain-containing protein [Paenibacillus sp. MER 78]MCM3128843.1 DUF1992 domain-containing protein [Paenibacillus sp. MER 78]
MSIFSRIAEQKIAEAMKRGELDHLPGAGKPLVIEDLSHVPEDLRASYKILKNSGYLPPELELQQECLSLEQMIRLCQVAEDKEQMIKKLTEKQIKLRIMLEERGISHSPPLRGYEEKISSKLGDE